MKFDEPCPHGTVRARLDGTTYLIGHDTGDHFLSLVVTVDLEFFFQMMEDEMGRKEEDAIMIALLCPVFSSVMVKSLIEHFKLNGVSMTEREMTLETWFLVLESRIARRW